MAVNVDTVYQRVLALANKEQRGYITPQEFNLFANQAQMSIFEQYFYEKNQYNRLPKDNTPYADLNHLLEEKISIFKKRNQPVTITNAFGDGTLPTDVYRLDNVIRFSLTSVGGSTANIIEEVTEDEFILNERSPLAAATIKRPVYVRNSETSIKISPRNTDPSKSAAVFFTQDGDTSTDNTPILDTGGNLAFVEVGQVVTDSAGTIPTSPATTVTVAPDASGNFTISAAATAGLATTFTFASDDVKCNYIRKPADVSWAYTEVNGSALFNSASAVNFELHASEETSLVLKILSLAGISIDDPSLYQIAAQEIAKEVQQEKQ